MLREPTARTLSAFHTMTGRVPANAVRSSSPVTLWTAPHHHFSCPPGSRGAQVLAKLSSSFEDFANLPKSARQECWSSVANQQTRYLAPDMPEDSDEQLNAAKARLSTFAWFGVVEQFQESMQLLRSSLQLELQLYSPVFNMNKYDKNLSKHARDVLIEMNSNDLKLYAYAYRLFERRVAHMKARWDHERNSDSSSSTGEAGSFVCDNSDLICWDKSQKDGPWWPLLQAGTGTAGISDGRQAAGLAVLARLTPGERKQQVLCGPRRGCVWTSDRKGKASGPDSGGGQDRAPLRAHASSDAKGGSAKTCWPSFLIIGARKGGTTSLYKYLTHHPKVTGIKLHAGAQTGELLFFRNITMRQSRLALRQTNLGGTAVGSGGNGLGLPPLDTATVCEGYNRAFWRAMVDQDASWLGGEDIDGPGPDPAGFPDVVTGESSVDMAASCATPQLVKASCGTDLKLIFVARDPVARLISQLRMRQRMGKNLVMNSPSRRRSLAVPFAWHSATASQLTQSNDRGVERGWTDDSRRIVHTKSNADWSGHRGDRVGGVRRHLLSQRVRKSKVRRVTSPEEAITMELKSISDAVLRMSLSPATTTQNGVVETDRALVEQMTTQLPCLFRHDFENMVWAGLYSVHLERWLRAGFPRENLLILTSEELAHRPEQVVRQAMRFIGVDPDQVKDLSDTLKVRFNTAPDNVDGGERRDQVEISQELHQKLARFYAPFNADFAKRFGVDTSVWL
jgi:hypothetical protein